MGTLRLAVGTAYSAIRCCFRPLIEGREDYAFLTGRVMAGEGVVAAGVAEV